MNFFLKQLEALASFVDGLFGLPSSNVATVEDSVNLMDAHFTQDVGEVQEPLVNDGAELWNSLQAGWINAGWNYAAIVNPADYILPAEDQKSDEPTEIDDIEDVIPTEDPSVAVKEVVGALVLAVEVEEAVDIPAATIIEAPTGPISEDGARIILVQCLQEIVAKLSAEDNLVGEVAGHMDLSDVPAPAPVVPTAPIPVLPMGPEDSSSDIVATEEGMSVVEISAEEVEEPAPKAAPVAVELSMQIPAESKLEITSGAAEALNDISVTKSGESDVEMLDADTPPPSAPLPTVEDVKPISGGTSGLITLAALKQKAPSVRKTTMQTINAPRGAFTAAGKRTLTKATPAAAAISPAGQALTSEDAQAVGELLKDMVSEVVDTAEKATDGSHSGASSASADTGVIMTPMKTKKAKVTHSLLFEVEKTHQSLPTANNNKEADSQAEMMDIDSPPAASAEKAEIVPFLTPIQECTPSGRKQINLENRSTPFPATSALRKVLALRSTSPLEIIAFLSPVEEAPPTGDKENSSPGSATTGQPKRFAATEGLRRILSLIDQNMADSPEQGDSPEREDMEVDPPVERRDAEEDSDDEPIGVEEAFDLLLEAHGGIEAMEAALGEAAEQLRAENAARENEFVMQNAAAMPEGKDSPSPAARRPRSRYAEPLRWAPVPKDFLKSRDSRRTGDRPRIPKPRVLIRKGAGDSQSSSPAAAPMMNLEAALDGVANAATAAGSGMEESKSETLPRVENSLNCTFAADIGQMLNDVHMEMLEEVENKMAAASALATFADIASSPRTKRKLVSASFSPLASTLGKRKSEKDLDDAVEKKKKCQPGPAEAEMVEAILDNDSHVAEEEAGEPAPRRRRASVQRVAAAEGSWKTRLRDRRALKQPNRLTYS